MLGSISPYELLKASQIKSPTFSLDYDQQVVQLSSSHAASLQTPAPESDNAQPRVRISTAPTARTHYIADIKRRHTAASLSAYHNPR